MIVSNHLWKISGGFLGLVEFGSWMHGVDGRASSWNGHGEGILLVHK